MRQGDAHWRKINVGSNTFWSPYIRLNQMNFVGNFIDFKQYLNTLVNAYRLFSSALYFNPLILLDRIYFEIMILAINKYQELLKSRDITLLTKVCTVKAMVFAVVMYGCKSQTIKTENQRIVSFNLWYLKRPLRVP